MPYSGKPSKKLIIQVTVLEMVYPAPCSEIKMQPFFFADRYKFKYPFLIDKKIFVKK